MEHERLLLSYRARYIVKIVKIVKTDAHALMVNLRCYAVVKNAARVLLIWLNRSDSDSDSPTRDSDNASRDSDNATAVSAGRDRTRLTHTSDKRHIHFSTRWTESRARGARGAGRRRLYSAAARSRACVVVCTRARSHRRQLDRAQCHTALTALCGSVSSHAL